MFPYTITFFIRILEIRGIFLDNHNKNIDIRGATGEKIAPK